MCTRPLSIVRHSSVTGQSRTDIVPCGKCPDCLLRKQKEFAALAVLQAKRAKSVDFLTFTYANNAIPIMVSECYPRGGSRFVTEKEDLYQARYNCRLPNGEMTCASDGVLEWCPSLCRQDFLLFLKRTRLAFKRRFGYDPKFTYAGFGEYG